MDDWTAYPAGEKQALVGRFGRDSERRLAGAGRAGLSHSPVANSATLRGYGGADERRRRLDPETACADARRIAATCLPRWQIAASPTTSRTARMRARFRRGLSRPPPRRHPRGNPVGGSQGGRSALLAGPQRSTLRRLSTSNRRKPALGGVAETTFQSTVQSRVHRAVVGKLPGLLVAQPQGRRGPHPGAPAARSYSGLPHTPRTLAIIALRRSHGTNGQVGGGKPESNLPVSGDRPAD